MTEKEAENTEASVEELAEQLGWNPNWEGPEDERVSAKDYILRQQDILKKSSEDMSSLKDTVTQMRSQMQEMAENQGKEVTRALESQKRRLMEEREKAVTEGDTEAFKKADEALSSLQDAPKENPREKEFLEGYKQFQARHKDWWGKDWAMTGMAKNIAEVVGAANPDMSADEFYSTVEEEVKKAYPEKFSQPSHRPTQVSGDKPPKKSDSTAWNKLMEEFPDANPEGVFQGFVKQGIYKDTREDREKYAKAVLE